MSFISKMCGKNKVYIPEAGCDDCTKLEMRVSTLETEMDNVESRVDTLESCCDEVRTTLNNHDGRITSNSNLIQNLTQTVQSIVNRFSDYYTKSETYTQAQVDDIISQLQQGTYQEVDTLPATGEPHIIYLVPKQGGGKEQWIYSNGNWVDIGGTDIDLSDYVKVDDVVDMIHPVGDTVIRTDNINPGTLYTGTTWQKISEGRMLIGANATYALGSTGGNATHNHTNPTTNGSSAANTGANNGNTGASSAANTGSTTLTAAQSGNQEQTITSGAMSANSSKTGYFDIRKWGTKVGEGWMIINHGGIISNNPNGGVNANGTPDTSGNSSASQRITTSFDISHTHSVKVAAKNAASGHTHTMAHTHTLNNHTHTMAHTHNLGNHTHTMAHTHTQGNTGDSSNIPPYLAVNIWIRTA